MRTALLISTEDRPDRRHEAAGGRSPVPDYHALADALEAEVIDRRAAREALPAPVWAAACRLSRDLPQVLAAVRARRQYGRFLCDSERLGLPLAALLGPWRRPGSVVFVAHRVTAPVKRALLRVPWWRRQVHGVLCHADPQAECLLRAGLPPDRIHRVPFYVDAGFWRPADDGPDHLVLSVGRERRDYATLCAAAQELDCPVQILAHSPWSRRHGALERLAAPGNVSFLPPVSYDELRRLYAEAAVVAVPVQGVDFQAGITTVLEAMAMGRPVVATANPGLQELFAQGEAGLWVPPGHPKALAQALAYVLDHPVEAAAMGRRGRALVEQRLTLAHWVERVVRVVRSG